MGNVGGLNLKKTLLMKMARSQRDPEPQRPAPLTPLCQQTLPAMLLGKGWCFRSPGTALAPRMKWESRYVKGIGGPTSYIVTHQGLNFSEASSIFVGPSNMEMKDVVNSKNDFLFRMEKRFGSRTTYVGERKMQIWCSVGAMWASYDQTISAFSQAPTPMLGISSNQEKRNINGAETHKICHISSSSIQVRCQPILTKRVRLKFCICGLQNAILRGKSHSNHSIGESDSGDINTCFYVIFYLVFGSESDFSKFKMGADLQPCLYFCKIFCKLFLCFGNCKLYLRTHLSDANTNDTCFYVEFHVVCDYEYIISKYVWEKELQASEIRE